MIPVERQTVPLNVKFSSTAVVGLQPALPPSRGVTLPAVKPRIHAEVGRYRLRLAESCEDREAACRLRFKVFNIELGEGLKVSYNTGLDTDRFDPVCEHLLVEDRQDRRVVGTYRMQSGTTAAENLGYYSGQEFDLTAYEPLRPSILELGRASIDREHRTPEVLTLLWRGIAQYASNMNLRYLIGCSSINSKDPKDGWPMYHELRRYRVSPEFATEPMPAYACPAALDRAANDLLRETGDAHALQPSTEVKVPKLLKTYLAIGCRIGGPPAWDREFGTIDFLTFLDLELVAPSVRNRFLAPLV